MQPFLDLPLGSRFLLGSNCSWDSGSVDDDDKDDHHDDGDEEDDNDDCFQCLRFVFAGSHSCDGGACVARNLNRKLLVGVARYDFPIRQS